MEVDQRGHDQCVIVGDDECVVVAEPYASASDKATISWSVS